MGTRQPAGRDRERGRAGTGWLLGLLAAVVLALALGWGLMPGSAPAPSSAPPPASGVAPGAPTVPPVADAPPRPGAAAAPSLPAAPLIAAAPPAAAAASQIPRLRDPGGDQTPDVADHVNPGEQPTAREVIDRLRQAGQTGGLAAFAPPGTRPPLVGLGVPEDFELPPGYVRHHQATDDGRRIEPVLMFAPDFQLRDAQGRPVAMPADRVVPPELAPPGLPIRRIELPASAGPRR